MKSLKTMEKNFLIINLSYFGDVLLTNTLCQNIKREYPESKIIFLVNKPFYEAAKYQECVDDVICMDKRKEHKGLFGLLKFIRNNKYRNKIFATFIIYGNARGILVSYLLNSQKRISGPTKFVKFLLTNIIPNDDGFSKMQDINGNFIKPISGKRGELLPIKFKTNPHKNVLTQQLIKEYPKEEIIGLCCVSKQQSKDMPIQTTIELITLLNQKNKKVFLFGAGNASRIYADNIKKNGCTKFVDLTNITSIYDLANIISICKGVISVDTGTMHLSYATKCPTVCVFYKQDNLKKWAPSEDLYNVKIIDKNFSAENIYNKLISVMWFLIINFIWFIFYILCNIKRTMTYLIDNHSTFSSQIRELRKTSRVATFWGLFPILIY